MCENAINFVLLIHFIVFKTKFGFLKLNLDVLLADLAGLS